MKETDQHILAGSPVETVFNGKTYIWTQRGRKEQRKIRSEIAKVVAFIAGGKGLEDLQTITFSIDMINTVIEFCENNHTDMCEDMDDIEDYLLTSGAESWTELINSVFMPVYQAWLEPYVVGTQGAGKKPKTAGRAKRKSMK